MPGAITDKLTRVTDSETGRPVVALLASPGKAEGAVSININDATNWTTTTAIHFSIYTTTTIGGVSVKDSTSQTDWKGTLSGTTISNLDLTGGTDRAYTAGAIVEITPTSGWAKELYDWGIAHADQAGALIPAAVRTALGISNSSNDGWVALGSTITYQSNSGNKEYVINTSADESDTLSPGMRMKLTRGTTPPTQCTDLEASSSQYASKTSPTGISFTDDFTCEAWIKLESYPGSNQAIFSRYNGTSGWAFYIDQNGRITLAGYNAGGSNNSYVYSNQSIPLGRWVHVAVQLDMSAFTATNTTSYVTIDGAEVSSLVARGGTNPTALVQAGNLQLGNRDGGTIYFDGKIADARVWSGKRTVTEIRDNMNKQLVGNESNLVGYFKLNGDFNDSTANANNMTGSGGAVATNVDNPMNTTEYGIITKVTASQITLFTGTDYNIPNGTLSAPFYSRERTPYNFPASQNKWLIDVVSIDNTSALTNGAFVSPGGLRLSIPTGSWKLSSLVYMDGTRNAATAAAIGAGFSESSSTVSNGYEQSMDIMTPGGASGTIRVAFTAKPRIEKDFTSQTTVYFVVYGTFTSATLSSGASTTANNVHRLVAECAYV